MGIAVEEARCAERGQNLGSMTAQLMAMCVDYGPCPLEQALAWALTKDLVGVASIRHLVVQHAQGHTPPPPPVPLDGHPRLAATTTVSATTSTETRAETRAERRSVMARADRDPLYERACALGLHGLCARWGEFGDAPWVPLLIEVEESERRRPSLERRLRRAKIGAVRPMADFDWKHPKKIPRGQVEELFELRFLGDSTPQNLILLGPNGVGKTMIAKNLAHHAVTRGYQVRFTEAAAMLNDLATQDGPAALRRRRHRYIRLHEPPSTRRLAEIPSLNLLTAAVVLVDVERVGGAGRCRRGQLRRRLQLHVG